MPSAYFLRWRARVSGRGDFQAEVLDVLRVGGFIGLVRGWAGGVPLGDHPLGDCERLLLPVLLRRERERQFRQPGSNLFILPCQSCNAASYTAIPRVIAASNDSRASLPPPGPAGVRNAARFASNDSPVHTPAAPSFSDIAPLGPSGSPRDHFRRNNAGTRRRELIAAADLFFHFINTRRIG